MAGKSELSLVGVRVGIEVALLVEKLVYGEVDVMVVWMVVSLEPFQVVQLGGRKED